MVRRLPCFVGHTAAYPVTLDLMATVVSVQADSEEECARELEWQCSNRPAVPVLPPMLPTGSRRWIARVSVPDPQPAPATQ
jgi:hypothetical protein